MCTSEVDSSSSESSSISGSEYSDSKASIEGEHINERVYESVGEIRPSRFQPSGRNRARDSEEDHGPARCGRLNQESKIGECIYACK